MIQKIVTDTFFLSQKSQEVSQADLGLAKDLEDTLEAHKELCLGMAANMIGVKKRVIIINMGFSHLVMFNPVLTAQSQPYETEESCLSLTGRRPTRRYQKIEVAYLDKNWQQQTLTLTGITAQICQHELDHLQGILI